MMSSVFCSESVDLCDLVLDRVDLVREGMAAILGGCARLEGSGGYDVDAGLNSAERRWAVDLVGLGWILGMWRFEDCQSSISRAS
jgi:hypothetical protein